MNAPVPIGTLNVIGYATSLSRTMVPTTVAPVFSLRGNPESVLFPPFHMHEGNVCEGTWGTLDEFDTFARRGEVTALPSPIPARTDYELWIDADMDPQYESIPDAEEHLGAIAESHLLAAETALRQGELDKADRLAGVALCANDRLLDPLAIRAAIRRRQKREGAVRVMAKLAAPRYKQDEFVARMEHFAAMIPPTVGRPMAEVALKRPMDWLREHAA